MQYCNAMQYWLKLIQLNTTQNCENKSIDLKMVVYPFCQITESHRKRGVPHSAAGGEGRGWGWSTAHLADHVRDSVFWTLCWLHCTSKCSVECKTQSTSRLSVHTAQHLHSKLATLHLIILFHRYGFHLICSYIATLMLIFVIVLYANKIGQPYLILSNELWVRTIWVSFTWDCFSLQGVLLCN